MLIFQVANCYCSQNNKHPHFGKLICSQWVLPVMKICVSTGCHDDGWTALININQCIASFI